MTVLTGCGENQAVHSEQIELLEPSAAIVATEPVEYRNLYDADVYISNVYPYTEEYAFVSSAKEVRFLAFPGQEVKKGELLAAADTESLEEEIEKLEEKLATMEEDYLEYKQEMSEELAELIDEADNLGEMVEGLEEEEPEEFLYDEDGEKKENPAYQKWLEEYTLYDGKYRKEDLQVMVKEAALRQKTELYELDYNYDLANLNDLKEERDKYRIVSEMDGEVVAVGQTEYGAFDAAADTPVIAVGDGTRKILKCNYIQKSVINGADDIYAFIGGKRYELEYQPIDSKEYMRLTESGETVYTSFEIITDDTSNEPDIGDYAVIVIVNESRENVMTVLKDAIDRDTLGVYVYVLEGDKSVRRDVTVGMTDGVYTEILSGLKAGEQVLVQQPLQHGENEGMVALGAYSTTFMGAPTMYYPSITEVKNPVTYGTVCYVDNHVSLYEHVEEGQVLATITVQADEIEIKRKELKLQRLNERLQDIVDEGKTEENAKVISEKQEEIDELQQVINDMKQDARTTEIVAPKSGIIVNLESYTENQVLKPECEIVRIADENTCYLMIENQNQVLQCGNEVSIGYLDDNYKDYYLDGRIVNVSRMGVSKALQTEKAFIQVPPEHTGILVSISNKEDKKIKVSRMQIFANVKEMENVLVVPKEAVTELAGQTYVHIIDENGEIKAQSFIAGGHDGSHYWVVDGLTEGMKICLE